MNKEQYIEELKKLLEGLDPKEIEDAVRYCEEYFDEACSNGVEDVEKDLGTPQQFAQKIKNETTNINIPPLPQQTIVPKNEKKKHWPWIVVGIILIFLVVFFLINSLYGYYVKKEIMDEVIESKLEGKYNGTHHREVMELDAFSSVIYDGTACSFVILPSDQDRLEMRNIDKTGIIVTNENSQLKIEENNTKRKGKIILYTSKSLDDLQVVQDVGNIEIENIEIGSLDIKTQTGNVDLENVRSNRVTVDCQVGNVELSLLGDINEYGYQIDNDTGHTEFQEQEYAGSCHISQNMDREKIIQVYCKTGEVEVEFSTVQ